MSRGLGDPERFTAGRGKDRGVRPADPGVLDQVLPELADEADRDRVLAGARPGEEIAGLGGEADVKDPTHRVVSPGPCVEPNVGLAPGSGLDVTEPQAADTFRLLGGKDLLGQL